jgi:hypothetical protein
MKSIGLLDIDYSTVIRTKYVDMNSEAKRKKILVPNLDDDSY